MSDDLKKKLYELSNNDIDMLLEKGETYGDSWKKRGGVGAAMMLARKWDRIERALEQNGYDIFAAIQNVDYLIDDVQDLGCYLWLVRSEGMVLSREEKFVKSRPLPGDTADRNYRRGVPRHPYEVADRECEDDTPPGMAHERDPYNEMAKTAGAEMMALLDEFNVTFVNRVTADIKFKLYHELRQWRHDRANGKVVVALETLFNRYSSHVAAFTNERGRIVVLSPVGGRADDEECCGD